MHLLSVQVGPAFVIEVAWCVYFWRRSDSSRIVHVVKTEWYSGESAECHGSRSSDCMLKCTRSVKLCLRLHHDAACYCTLAWNNSNNGAMCIKQVTNWNVHCCYEPKSRMQAYTICPVTVNQQYVDLGQAVLTSSFWEHTTWETGKLSVNTWRHGWPDGEVWDVCSGHTLQARCLCFHACMTPHLRCTVPITWNKFTSNSSHRTGISTS